MRSINFRSVFLGFVVVALLACLGDFAAAHYFTHVFAADNISVRPFVATEDEYTVSNGRETLVDTVVLSRRSDGATSKMARFYNPDRSEKLRIRRVKLADGWVGMIFDTLQIKASGRMPANLVGSQKQALTNPPSECLWKGETTVSKSTLFGQTALQIQQGGDDSLTRTTLWKLPDFNCASVGGTLETRANSESEWHLVSKKILTSFAAINPDAQMFAGWDNYQEMKPSAILAELVKRSGGTAPSCPGCAKADQTYANWNK